MSGRTIIAEFSLAPTPPKPAKSDPNGYYECLGLDPREDWSDEDVQRAYWVRAKKFHPDGSDPNPEEFRRVQMAYAVLKDPEMRDKYDALNPKQQWLDEDIIAAIIKRALATGGNAEINPVDVIRKGLTHEDEAPPPPPGPKFDTFAYYYYEGEDVPTVEVREEWIEMLMRVMWSRGWKGELKVGFTTGEPHVYSKPWGDIIMVSGEPNTEAATYLLELSQVHAS